MQAGKWGPALWDLYVAKSPLIWPRRGPVSRVGEDLASLDEREWGWGGQPLQHREARSPVRLSSLSQAPFMCSLYPHHSPERGVDR